MRSYQGATVVLGNIAYFSSGYNVYSYTVAQDKWTELPPCKHQYFGMAVINNMLTAVGGNKKDGSTQSTLILYTVS